MADDTHNQAGGAPGPDRPGHDGIRAWSLRAPVPEGWTDRTTVAFEGTDSRVHLKIRRIPPAEQGEPTLGLMLKKEMSRVAGGPGDRVLGGKEYEINEREAVETCVVCEFAGSNVVLHELLVRDADGSVYKCVMSGPETERSSIDRAWSTFTEGLRIGG